ncbi:hypothetical protein PR048_031559 [Dryococelus australis]|uniref:Endonuclease/exonuclease/phosphatase domain-containing protein n=1 Tax=Dryococelus australis TaxID=614101 RepID=A0ABQ9G5N0_9NEOP|nr:hypothetical protein PR048_031559 [Dryococelus australis]
MKDHVLVVGVVYKPQYVRFSGDVEDILSQIVPEYQYVIIMDDFNVNRPMLKFNIESKYLTASELAWQNVLATGTVNSKVTAFNIILKCFDTIALVRNQASRSPCCALR